MLVPFAVDPEVFNCSAVDRDCRRRHIELLKLWGQTGQLVIPGARETDSRLYRSLNSSPQPLQVLWRHALKSHRKRCGPDLLDTAMSKDTPTALGPACAGVSFVTLEEKRAALWGIPVDDFRQTIARGVEICRFGGEVYTEAFRASSRRASTPIAPGESVASVWDEIFAGFVSASRVLTVVDRYSIKNFIEQQRNGSISGLERLIRRLAGLGTLGKKILHVYAGYSLDWRLVPSATSFSTACKQIASEVEALCSTLRGGSLQEIQLHIAADSKHGSIDHYRYVRFDENTVLLLDTGLEPLSGSTVARTCIIGLKDWLADEAKPIRNDEGSLRRVVEPAKTVNCS